jgi:hypothetical protein
VRTRTRAAQPGRPALRLRFWVETALASVTGILAGVTIVWHEWIEAFGFDPDHGDGTWEWAIVLALAAATLALAGQARHEYRRAASAPT